MIKCSFIFPDGQHYICSNHVETVKLFLNNLRRYNQELYNKAFEILQKYYFNGSSYNYDDFAIFTLGWIKITTNYIPVICFAGYTFQYKLINSSSDYNMYLDIVPNSLNYPSLFMNLDFIALLRL